jgi:hypothetical protein
MHGSTKEPGVPPALVGHRLMARTLSASFALSNDQRARQEAGIVFAVAFPFFL